MARDNFIGGAWLPARTGATDPVVEPATGVALDEVASSDAADVDAAVAAAADAFDEWSAHARRAHAASRSRKVADAIDADLRASAGPRVANVGKPVAMIEFEMDLTVDNWRFFAGRRPLPRGPGRRRVHARTTPRSCGATRSASSRRSRRGTTRSTWRRGRSGPRSPRATPSCSSRRSSRRSPRCGWPRSPPTSCRRACSTSSPARARRPAPRSSRTRRGDGVAHRRRRHRQADRARPPPTRSSASTSSSAARHR